MMNGKGVYHWNDGRKYEGEYLNDQKHGHGRYTWQFKFYKKGMTRNFMTESGRKVCNMVLALCI